ncbi:cysteine desulfurase family protein [Sphingobium algorifonticola]|uniref:Cysteine desulfurase n=1 Tax=Sphingobium algorifonticola TaxID=2008318 RepID=A0A437J6T0_9SPHN|nr:cysteine desulfurase family protein [Sphingobium algorifonticola]RVT40859.1 cysteine desulfurase [Sphingobium algorifonticola]
MIYLDYQATTPLAPEVFEAMMPLLRDQFGNPHSMHRMGRQAAAHVELARERIAAAMALGVGRIIFTSGATEALNIAIHGFAQAAPAGRRRIVTLASEHAAVRDTAMAFSMRGFEIVLLPVGADGIVDLDRARAAITEGTALVSAMLVNNEIGVIQPVDALAAMAHDAGAPFLCDAVQGFGRVPLPGEADAIAISAHKIHGPKGVGALWLRAGIDLPPLLHGGGQEQGLRSGTLSPALCAGFGMAAQLAATQAAADGAHVAMLWDRALALFDGWTVNGSVDARYRGNLNIRRDGIDGARLLSDCRDIAFSLGSACASGSGRPSHVLQAIGLSDKEARGSVRIGFGRYTRIDELEDAAKAIVDAAAQQAPVASGAHGP